MSIVLRSSPRYRLLALAALFVALCLTYSLSLPIFEAPDEADHFSYANWLADGHGLPHLVRDREQVGEIWQPPLYYALLAPLISPVDRTDIDTIAPLSEDWLMGLTELAHTHTTAETFPYSKAVLAVRLARVMSILLGLVTIFATYGIARTVIPAYALLAAVLVAMNPQFIFMSAVINNDNLVIAVASVTLLVLVRLTAAGQNATDRHPAPSPSWWQLAGVGVLIGLAVLAKLTGIALLLVAGIALLILARQARSWRVLWIGGLIVGGLAAAVSGWWFWRNQLLYGDPLAWQQMLDVTGGLVRAEPLGWLETIKFATFLRQTYWASFGYGLLGPDGFYLTTYALMGLAALGLLERATSIRRWDRTAAVAFLQSPVFLLIVWSLTVFLLLLRWMRQIDFTNQGRLLFPAIASLAVLAAIGLGQLDPKRRWVSKGAAGLLGFWAAALPFLVILPTYERPLLLSEAAVIPNPIQVQFGEELRLRGYELPPPAVPGESVEVALYWQAAQPVEQSYLIALRVLDAAGQVAAGVDTLPYAGRYPTQVWEPERPFRDTYELPPLDEAAVPGRGALLVTVYPSGDPDNPLPVIVDGAVTGEEILLGPLKIVPETAVSYDPDNRVNILFGDKLGLLGYDLNASAAEEGALSLTLYWEAVQPDDQDYTVFVHLIDKDGNLIAQVDGQPQQSRFPTSIWSAGEQISDERVIPLPDELLEGEYTIMVGLYDSLSGVRLTAVDGITGVRPENNAVQLLTIYLQGAEP